MEKIAVFHDSHTVGYDIATWMLKSLGYKVYVAGESFRPVLPNYRSDRYPPGRNFLTRSDGHPPWDGVMEVEDLPRDALFLDTFPETEHALRRYGWEGPILFYWILPVGRSYIARGNFRPGRGVAVLAFNAAVARSISERGLCPVASILPPYDSVAAFRLRETFEPFLITVVNKAVDWTPWSVRLRLSRLRRNPKTRLELYGLPPPRWAAVVEHPQLVARIARAAALFHVKTIDTPGYAWMEAALQGVPVIFRPEFIDNTEFSFLEHGRTCFIAERGRDIVRYAERLKDPSENRRIGLALRERVTGVCSWETNRGKVGNLLDSLRRN